MEKKKINLIILVIVFVGIFNLAKNVRADFGFYLYYFNTDKDTYYNDETIYINGSWWFSASGGSSGYNQVRIYDEAQETILWNSTCYVCSNGQQKTTTEEWEVKISELDLNFSTDSNRLFVCIWYYLVDGGFDEGTDHWIWIDVIKRNVSCELINFKPTITYGDVIDFKARFYSSENNSDLMNHLVSVKIVSNNVIHYTKNFTTNSSGMINIVIPTFNNITVGEYNLILDVIENKFYNKSTLEYQLSVVSRLDNEPSSPADSDSEDKENKNSNVLPLIFSILSISCIAFLILYHTNFRKPKEHDLADLTFKF